jgi:hypothetical protein
MPTIEIAVINEYDGLNDMEVGRAVAALQKQVSGDFAAAWGIDAKLTVAKKGETPKTGAWWLVILDNSDQAGALGYHDLTSEGLPLGKVFAGTDKQYSEQWTVTASHELLEMLGDPDINLTVFVQPDARSGRLYAYEVCDACEADEFAYAIDGVPVSDFVFPSWFEAFRQPGSTQFDQRNKITKPFELLPGGYIGEFDVSSGSGWVQLTPKGAQLEYRNRPRVGSRRERRRTLRSHWLRSKPKGR